MSSGMMGVILRIDSCTILQQLINNKIYNTDQTESSFYSRNTVSLTFKLQLRKPTPHNQLTIIGQNISYVWSAQFQLDMFCQWKGVILQISKRKKLCIYKYILSSTTSRKFYTPSYETHYIYLIFSNHNFLDLTTIWKKGGITTVRKLKVKFS